MKLPSLRQAFQEARVTLRRFPFVICDAVLATAAALVLIDYQGPARPSILFNILLAGILGIPLLTALSLVSERKRYGMLASIGLQLFGALLLVGYAFTVPTDLTHAPTVTLFRFSILAVALHLFVAYVPYAAKSEINGFWHYNKTLFMRVLTALLFSLVLYVGLAIALAAVDNLFGIEVPGKRYPELWIFINGVFTTWFFLAGVPEDLKQLDTLTEYPKGLKVFAQYILFPIVLIYLVILYAYLAKIVVAWDWPEGWVSKLILGFAGTGMFLLLLLHPITGRTENVWVSKASRWFYVVLIPLVVMLFLAVWRRVAQYGFTEGRYLAIALGIWLAFLIVYYTLSRAKSIKVVPASLCLFAFIVSFGPWGAFSVARESQIGRLEKIATQAGILSNGKIHPVKGEIPAQDAKQISAILSYLHENHGFGGIQEWFDENLKEDTIRSGIAYKSPPAVAKLMGMKYVERWAEVPGAMVMLAADSAFDLTGYDRMGHLSWFPRGADHAEPLSDGISYRVTEGLDTLTFTIASTGAQLLQIDLQRHAASLMEKYGTSPTGRIPNDAIAVSASGNGLRVRVCPWQIQVQRREGETKILGMNAVILYSLEKSQ
ncbi:MAG: DUF4153 domain-containing protein [Bacteroidota bacterium]